ncbi:MAG: GNAT family N-acetyltransferase [Acidobacteriota bacterium]
MASSVRRALLRPEFVGRQCVVVVRDGRRPLARAVTRLEDGGLGYVGFFEAHDDLAATRLLFDRAIAWLRERGATRIIGPSQGDTWHAYRLSVGPYDCRPFLSEPYNPPYYERLWLDAGFATLAEYASHRMDEPRRLWERLAPRLEAARSAGYGFETLRLDRFDRELERLYALSCRAFQGNFLYRLISFEHFRSLYAGIERLLDPELVVFAVAPDGSDAGFFFSYPDHARSVAALRGGDGLTDRIRFLAARRHSVDTVNMKSLAVLPEHRRAHVGSALTAAIYEAALAKGYRKTHHCLIQQDNPSARFEAGMGRLLRRYRLYEHVETRRAS